MTEGFKVSLMWVGAALVGLVVMLYPVTATFVDGSYVPVGPDGFYHARRILDAVADPGSFFQFDTYTEVPEGNLVTWPWFYDYALSFVVRLAVALGLARDPVSALAHIPAFLFPFALLLVVSICRALALSPVLTLLAMVATACFPLNQTIYAVGCIDHHFAEHLFVLGTLTAALHWFKRPESRIPAVICGLSLGLASGVHSALFVLQLPLLGTFLLSWLRRQALPRHVPSFAATLVITQLAVALPSLPLRLGHFNYYTLSWFQPYVAACTSVIAVLLARLPFSRRTVALLAGVSLLLLLPTLHQVLYAGDFFTNSIGDMSQLIEVRSVAVMWAEMGTAFVSANYSWLILLLPLTALLCAWWVWRERDAMQTHFAVVSLAGLALLTAQTRLHYFGSLALYLPWLVALHRQWDTARARLAATSLAAIVLLVAFAGGLQSRVFAPQILSGDPNYAATRSMYALLAARCAEAPGVVLADPLDGHYIRYHSRCSVIANNFLVTRQDVDKWLEAKRLLGLRASQLAAEAPSVRYLLLRRASIFTLDQAGFLTFAPGEYPGKPDHPLVRELLAADAGALPVGFKLVYEMRPGAGQPPFARLLAIEPVAGAEAAR